jgi:hypothetical protein
MCCQLRLKELDAVCGDAGLVLSGANHLLADAKKALSQPDIVLVKSKRSLDLHLTRVQANATQLRSHGPAAALQVVVPIAFDAAALDSLGSYGAVGAPGTSLVQAAPLLLCCMLSFNASVRFALLRRSSDCGR